MCRCGSYGHGLGVDLAVLGEHLDLMTIKGLFQPKHFCDSIGSQILLLFEAGTIAVYMENSVRRIRNGARQSEGT